MARTKGDLYIIIEKTKFDVIKHDYLKVNAINKKAKH